MNLTPRHMKRLNAQKENIFAFCENILTLKFNQKKEIYSKIVQLDKYRQLKTRVLFQIFDFGDIDIVNDNLFKIVSRGIVL